MNFETIEIGKLIQFAYDLHEKGLEMNFSRYVPNFKYNYGGNSPKIKEIDKGAVFGRRGYANHSESTVYTMLGVVIGNHLEKGFEYIKSIKFDAANDIQKGIYINILKLDNDKSSLICDCENKWDSLNDEMKLTFFLDAMETVGFRRNDVLDVLEGRKTAEQAFIAVASNDIVNKRWVNLFRKHFIFDGKTLIKGNLASFNLDNFPFPFEGPAIIDCSVTETSCIEFGENINGHKLVNINCNSNSIRYTDIKNAIIDEIIDLSIVNATATKIGHHVVINLDKSITPLKNIDLTFAIDENGNNFEVDVNGVVQFDENGKLKTFCSPANLIESKKINNFKNITNIKIFTNADSAKEVEKALENGADGIGLIRTEHMFFDSNNIPLFIGLFINNNNYDELLVKCARIQKIQATNIFKIAKGKRVIFRLLDAKLDEFMNCIEKPNYINFNKIRGAELLLEFPSIIKMQVKEILEAASETRSFVDFLVPMITDKFQFSKIKSIIDEIANERKFSNYRIGAMIENMSMANNADVLAREADFISFGTNDLTESVTGLSRHSEAADFINLNDKVKDIIKEGIYRAKVANPSISIGFCGEHSSHLSNLEFMKRMGADYISCTPSFISTARHIFTSIESENLNFPEEERQKIMHVLK